MKHSIPSFIIKFYCFAFALPSALIKLCGTIALLNGITTLALAAATECPSFTGIYFCPHSEHYVSFRMKNEKPQYSCSRSHGNVGKNWISVFPSVPDSVSSLDPTQSLATCFLNHENIQTVAIRCVNPRKTETAESFSLTTDSQQNVFEAEMTLDDYSSKSFRYQAPYSTPCQPVASESGFLQFF